MIKAFTFSLIFPLLIASPAQVVVEPEVEYGYAERAEYERISHYSVEKEPSISEWINELEKYESETVKDKDNYKRVDVNGYYSYGCMQFQLYTFIRYYEQWKDIEITESEARKLIADCERQKDLAEWMIEINPENWTHWYHSVHNRGLDEPPNL